MEESEIVVWERIKVLVKMFFCMSLVYIKCSDEETANLIRTHPDLIRVLALASSVEIMVNQSPPTGCAVQTVSAKCETHLMIKVGEHP